MKSKTIRIIFEYLQTVVIAVVLALVVHTYIAEARWIPSESMLPTLKVGDRLMTEKFDFKLTGINRGDIVTFNPPPAVHENEVLIKRVIGLPGETVAVKNGTVYINGEPVIEPYIKEKPKSDFKEYTVPADCLFVMGDNRNNSYDSRFWGPLPVKNVIGRALFKYYPLNDLGLL